MEHQPPTTVAFRCTVCETAIARRSFHYGAVTCFACKMFFCRNIHKKERLLCIGSGECPVLSTNRSRSFGCKYCRLQKCVSAGMKESLVIMMKRKKSSRNKSNTALDSATTKEDKIEEVFATNNRTNIQDGRKSYFDDIFLDSKYWATYDWEEEPMESSNEKTIELCNTGVGDQIAVANREGPEQTATSNVTETAATRAQNTERKRTTPGGEKTMWRESQLDEDIFTEETEPKEISELVKEFELIEKHKCLRHSLNSGSERGYDKRDGDSDASPESSTSISSNTDDQIYSGGSSDNVWNGDLCHYGNESAASLTQDIGMESVLRTDLVDLFGCSPSTSTDSNKVSMLTNKYETFSAGNSPALSDTSRVSVIVKNPRTSTIVKLEEDFRETPPEEGELTGTVTMLREKGLAEVFSDQEEQVLIMQSSDFWGQWKEFHFGEILVDFTTKITTNRLTEHDWNILNNVFRARLIACSFCMISVIQRINTFDQTELLKRNVQICRVVFDLFYNSSEEIETKIDLWYGERDLYYLKNQYGNGKLPWFTGRGEVSKFLQYQGPNKQDFLKFFDKFKRKFFVDKKIVFLMIQILILNPRGCKLIDPLAVHTLREEFFTMLRKFVMKQYPEQSWFILSQLEDCLETIPGLERLSPTMSKLSL